MDSALTRSRCSIAGRRCCLIVAIAIALGAVAGQAAEVSLRPQAAPRSNVVRLGDVADVRDDDVRHAERLAALPLMPAPAPGTQRFLRVREVQDMLAAQGEDISLWTFSGVQQVTIGPPDTTSATDDAATQLMNERSRRAALLSNSIQSRFEPLTPAKSQELQNQLHASMVEHLTAVTGQHVPWSVTFDVSERHLRLLQSATSPPSCDGGREPWTGKQELSISFATADGDVRFSLHVAVTRPEPVVVATREISRGAIITAAVLDVQQLDDASRTSGRRTTFAALDQLIGMEATQTIQAGDLLHADAVQSPVLVKRGDEVTVFARGGGIQVRTRARARSDGARGDLVQVESLDTRERYDARVVGPREAIVLAGSTTPIAKESNPPARTAWR